MGFMQARGIPHILIQPGKPTQNACIERFNGKFRDECLNENWFESLAEAREAPAICGVRTTTRFPPTTRLVETHSLHLPPSTSKQTQPLQ